MTRIGTPKTAGASLLALVVASGAMVIVSAARAGEQSNSAAASDLSPLDACSGQADGIACNDGNACTSGETCRGGACAAPLTFTLPGSTNPVETGPRAVVAGDWNLDGKLDLAVANRTSNTISILLGDGLGAFGVPSSVAVGTGPIAIAVGDWDRNGAPDLAVANSTANSLTILLGNGLGGFTANPLSPIGATPVSIAGGDLNGDGLLDLAVAYQNANTVGVFLGNGSGGFGSGVFYLLSAGATPVFVAAADFNRDGALDLVVANQGLNSVTILLNGPSGFHFDGGSPVPTGGTGPFSIAVGDLTGDGLLDLAVANFTSNDVTVLLGNGAGGFSPAPESPVSVGTQPRSVIMRDLNRDGRLDLAVASFTPSNVTILLGNGTGGFGPAASSPISAGTNAGPSALIGADLDGDGRQDLVVANTNANNVRILKNNTAFVADGTSCDDLNPCTSTETCVSGVCTAASLAADGTGCSDGSPCTLGETCRAGSCLPPFTVTQPGGTPVDTTGTQPRAVVAGDWDGDGTLDLAVANRTSNNLSILHGTGGGGYDPPTLVPAGSGPIAIAVGDWNGNGALDLAVADSNTGANNITILMGDGSGGFGPGSSVLVGTVPVSVAAGDLNGDGKLDLAVSNQNSGDVTILLGDGSGGFNPAAGSPVGVGTFPVSVAVGDLNGDGRLNLAVANQTGNSVSILLGTGSGEFVTAAGSPVSAGTGPFSVATGDLNGDGILDLAVANFSSNNVWVLLGNGLGGFAPAPGTPTTVGTQPRSVVARDLNRDGRLDLAVASFTTSNLTILLGKGGGTFTAAAVSPVGVGTGPSSVIAGDLDADGKLDLAVANTTTHNVTILLNNTATAANGSGCSDANACTQTDTCQAGACMGGNPVVCTALDQCHLVGTCVTGTGVCPNPLASNGSDCSDGVTCTDDACSVGVCVGTPIDAACGDGRPCTSDACDAVIGCYHTGATSGSCSDFTSCTTGTCSVPCNGGYTEDFDGVTRPALPAGWTTTLLTGLPGDTVWRTVANGDTLPNAVSALAYEHVTDIVLVTPPFPAGLALLSFRVNSNMPSTGGIFLDGVVLEIKIGAGAFQDILAAGGSFASGGYNHTISACCGSPIAGRQAWSGVTGVGWEVMTVNLPPSAAGQNVVLRWRMATSESGDFLHQGMTIDTIFARTCASVCGGGPPIGSPAEVTGERWSVDKGTLFWDATTFAETYDTIRDLLTLLPVGPSGEAHLCNSSATGVSDVTPSPGTGFFYVIRAKNQCGPPGTYGLQSNGTPRTTTTCP